MNKTILIIVVVVILILLGGGVFFFLGKSHTNPSQSGQTAKSQSQAPQMPSGKKSLFDLLSMTGSQKCTFTDKETGASGTTYVSGGKMRGDFQSNDNGKATSAHMINDGKFVYYWIDGSKTGYKMSLDMVKQQASEVSIAPGQSSEERTPSQAIDMKQKADYSCGPWSANASMFAIPTDITFADYSAMMQGAKQSSPAGKTMAPNNSNTKGSQAACAQCDQAPAGAARNQCKAILKCQ